MSPLGEPGTILAGKFRVLSRLGEGGMGEVVAVRHLELGGQFALKLIEGGDAERVARLRREARAAAKLRGPHVVRVTDVGVEGTTPFLVMELVEGGTLASLLAHGPLPVVRAVSIALDVCEALAEAHANGVVHRDIKPSNILLADRPGDEPIVKVADFGIAKTAPTATTEVAPLTRASAILGSPAYMSPQQLRDPRFVDGRTDVWSLGVVLFEMLTGKLPFSAYTTPALLAAISMDEPPRPSELAPSVPRALDAVVLRCLEKDVDRRYATAADLAADLAPFGADPRAAQRVAAHAAPRPAVVAAAAPTRPPAERTEGATTVTSGEEQAVTAPTPARARKGLALAVGVLALVGGAVGGVVLANRRAAPPVVAPTPPPPASVVAAPPPGEPPQPSATPPAPASSATPAASVAEPKRPTPATRSTQPTQPARPEPTVTGPGPQVGKFGGRI